jgi:hypothetical protein
MKRRRSPISVLNPFSRIERSMADDRLAGAVAVVESLRPDLCDRGVEWFGGGLDGDTRARYVAVGFTPAPDLGLDEGRAFVVDVRTGHVIWQRPLSSRRELPRNIAVLVG